MDKSSDAFRTISEVAGDLDLPQHVLRFWETRFSQIKPLKRGGGRRYYRPDDVELLKGIRHLLYGEGYTIKGVQRILKDHGVRFVMALWHEGAPQPASWADDHKIDVHADTVEAYDDTTNETASDVRGTGWADQPSAEWRARPDDDVIVPRPTGVAFAGRRSESQPAANLSAEPNAFGIAGAPSPESIAQRFAPLPGGNTQTHGREDLGPRREWAPQTRQGSSRPVADRQTAATGRRTPAADSFAAVPASLSEAASTDQGLTRDEVRRLQATLFELLECKRLLDQAR